MQRLDSNKWNRSPFLEDFSGLSVSNNGILTKMKSIKCRDIVDLLFHFCVAISLKKIRNFNLLFFRIKNVA